MKTHKILMTRGNIWKELILFSLPLLAGNLLQQLYNVADSVIVGNALGKNALAAVGAGTFLINFLIAFSMGIAAGAGVVVAQKAGAQNKKALQEALHTSLGLSAILGTILTVTGILFSPRILSWMNTPLEIMNDSTLYLRIYSGGLVFSVLYNMAAGILMAVGDSVRPLIYLAVAAVVNIVLDLLFILGLHFGVAGAAFATDISQALACLLVFRFLLRTKEDYRFQWSLLHLNKGTMADIVRIGLPTGLQNTLISLSNVFVQTAVNGFGVAAVAGFGAYMKIDGFNILPVLSLALAVSAFSGQNYGARKTLRIQKGIKITLCLGLLYCLTASALLIGFARPVIRLFTTDEEALSYGVLALKYICAIYFMVGIMQILAGALRGIGKAVAPMLILLFSLCLFRIGWIHWAVPLFHSLDGVLWLYPISFVLGMSLMALYAWFAIHPAVKNSPAKQITGPLLPHIFYTFKGLLQRTADLRRG